jgi:hypothetical protein
VASKPGGLNITKSLQPRELGPYGSRCTELLWSCRVALALTKADVSWEETGKSTRRTTGVWVQASRERFAEITLGRACFQQGRAATCKDSWYKGKTEAVRGLRSSA